MDVQRNYEEMPFLDLGLQEKPEAERIPGKPYPEDFGTNLKRVYAFIEEYWAERDRRPMKAFLIIAIVVGAFLLGFLFYLFYEHYIIFIMFATLGGYLGYAAYMSIFHRRKRAGLNKLQLNTPEGVYLRALELWTERKRKEDIAAIRAHEEELKKNPWIITDLSLFPEDPLYPTEGTIEPILDENGVIIDYQFDYPTIMTHMTFPIWYSKNEPTGIDTLIIVQHSIEKYGKYVDINKATRITAHRKLDGINTQFLKWDKDVLYEGKIPPKN